MIIKLTKLIQKDFVFINTDSRSRLWIIAETKQNLPSWLNEGNSCMNTSSFRRRSMGCQAAREVEVKQPQISEWLETRNLARLPSRVLFFNSFYGVNMQCRTHKKEKEKRKKNGVPFLRSEEFCCYSIILWTFIKARFDNFLFTIKYHFPSLPNSNILIGDILHSSIV